MAPQGEEKTGKQQAKQAVLGKWACRLTEKPVLSLDGALPISFTH
ncbi:MAG: hypothetical protein PHI94_04065 [Eubacteriaceae bacterium]|nr:hypothetical protein [Eubacteriaceae bacterium]MDD4507919.1 hypothetical protein [Eubacteriaceae bacterium]